MLQFSNGGGGDGDGICFGENKGEREHENAARMEIIEQWVTDPPSPYEVDAAVYAINKDSFFMGFVEGANLNTSINLDLLFSKVRVAACDPAVIQEVNSRLRISDAMGGGGGGGNVGLLSVEQYNNKVSRRGGKGHRGSRPPFSSFYSLSQLRNDEEGEGEMSREVESKVESKCLSSPSLSPSPTSAQMERDRAERAAELDYKAWEALKVDGRMCNICLDLLAFPCLVDCKNTLQPHVYCGICALDLLKGDKDDTAAALIHTCPVCRSDISSYFPVPLLDAFILSMVENTAGCMQEKADWTARREYFLRLRKVSAVVQGQEGAGAQEEEEAEQEQESSDRATLVLGVVLFAVVCIVIASRKKR